MLFCFPNACSSSLLVSKGSNVAESSAQYICISRKVAVTLHIENKNKKTIFIIMNTLLIGFVALLAVALVGWAVAELKGRTSNYHNNEEEAEELAAFVNADGFQEKTIFDSQKKNSIKGYNAV